MDIIMPAIGVLGLIVVGILFWLSGYHTEGRCFGKWVGEDISLRPLGFIQRCNKCGAEIIT